MNKSLQEQLLKAGLVDRNKAKQINKDKYKKRKQTGRPGGPGTEDATAQTRKAAEEKIRRDRELNQAKEEQARQKSIVDQIRQLIDTNRLATEEGDLAFHFEDRQKIKRIRVTNDVHRQLSRGELAIVRSGSGYVLVKRPVAEKIRLRDPGWVVFCPDTQPAEPRDDDPYAAYEVPDDLIW